MIENAHISETKRIRLGSHTDLSPYGCPSRELSWVTAAAKITVQDHEHIVAVKLVGRAVVLLRCSLIEDPAVTTVALVYLEGEWDRRSVMERVHAQGYDRLELEKEGLTSFHEGDPRKRRERTRCQIICGKSWGLDEPYSEKHKQTKIGEYPTEQTV